MSEDEANFERKSESESNLRQNIRKWGKFREKNSWKELIYHCDAIFTRNVLGKKILIYHWRDQGGRDDLFSANHN